MKSNLGKWIKRILYWGLIFAFFWFVHKYFADIEEFINVVKTAHYTWFAVAFLFSQVAIIATAVVYRASVVRLGFKETSLFGAIQNYFVFMFVSVINPTSGWGGTLYHANRYSSLSPRALGGALVGILITWVMYGFWSFLLVFPALHILSSYNSYVRFLGVIAVGLYAVQLFMICMTFYWGLKRPVALNRFAHWLSHKWNRIGGLFSMSTNSFEVNIHDYCMSTQTVAHSGSRYIPIGIGTLLIHILQIVTMSVLFLAFGAEITVTGVLMCYSLLFLFTTISPTPQGIGIAEGLVQVVMVSLGYGSGESLAVILAYRGITLWVPLLIGFVLFKKINMFRSNSDSQQVNSVAATL